MIFLENQTFDCIKLIDAERFTPETRLGNSKLIIHTREKKSAIKSPNISNFFRQRSGYISDFTLINPEKNLADFRGFNSTNPLSF